MSNKKTFSKEKVDAFILDDRDIVKVSNFNSIMSELSMFKLACLKYQDKLTYNDYIQLKRYIDNFEKSIIKILQ